MSAWKYAKPITLNEMDDKKNLLNFKYINTRTAAGEQLYTIEIINQDKNKKTTNNQNKISKKNLISYNIDRNVKNLQSSSIILNNVHNAS